MKIVMIIALSLIMLSLPAEAETLKMAVFQLEPFMMQNPDGKEAAGVTVEYWKSYLAPSMGYDIEVLGPYPIRRVEKMLENGDVDIVSQFTKIQLREERFLYPETHLTTITSCLAVTPDSPIVSVTKPEDLYGKKIGFIESGYVPPFFIHPEISIDKIGNEDYRQINLNKLFAGRVDALLDINHVSYIYYLKQRDYMKRVRLIMLPVEDVKVYSIFRKTQNGRMLAGKYDSANRKGLAEGVFIKITEQYLSGNPPYEHR